jgi:hypothetical protein
VARISAIKRGLAALNPISQIVKMNTVTAYIGIVRERRFKPEPTRSATTSRPPSAPPG